jgi:hypothetical protein
MPFVESAAYRVYDEEHGRGDAILFVGGITGRPHRFRASGRVALA